MTTIKKLNAIILKNQKGKQEIKNSAGAQYLAALSDICYNNTDLYDLINRNGARRARKARAINKAKKKK
jgi:hypothetical protein